MLYTNEEDVSNRVKKAGPKYDMAQNRPDNFGTPQYALEPLIKYIDKENDTIWECAAGEGLMVDGLRNLGCRKVIGSTIEIEGVREGIKPGIDFLKNMIKSIPDIIITNPPYTIKDKFLERCYQLQQEYEIGFALLMPITALEGKKRMALYEKYGLQLIMPPGRINYVTPVKKLSEGNGSSAFFYSAWFTNGLNLPKDINFVTEWNK